MATKDYTELATKIVKAIEADIADRTGTNFDKLADDIREEIKQEWIAIVKRFLVRNK